MKFKKFMALGLVAAMTATLFAGCGSKGNDSADTTQKSDSASADGLVSYSDIVLGETGKDLSATITMFNHRTDMDTDDYGGKNWKSYLEDFNKEYPNIKADSRNLRPEKYRIYQRQLLLPDHSGRYCRLRRFKPQPSVPFL